MGNCYVPCSMLETQIRVSFCPLGTHHLAQEINSELYFIIDAFNIGNAHKKRVKILPEKSGRAS